MASTPVTRAALVTRLIQRANTSGYIDSTAEAPQLIDTSLAKCYNWLATTYEDYFVKKAPPYQLTAAGRDTFPIPADFLKAREIFYVTTSGSRYPLVRMNISDLTGTAQTSSYQQPVFGYLVADQDLVIYPRPSQSQTGTIEMWYIPEYTPALNDSVPVFPALAFGWDEWVVLDACIAARLKSMMPVDDLMAERAQLERKILSQMKNRDAGQPYHVKDTGWSRFGFRGSQFSRS